LTAVGRLPDLTVASPFDAGLARVRQRDVWFPATGFVPAYVHWRNGLAAGMAIAGPAIIEAMDSTTVVPPGWIGRIDDLGYIQLVRN
jgi:N-methylhydantoinase A